MKRFFIGLAMALMCLLMFAQGESIRFTLLEATGEDVPAVAAKAFDTKLRTAFNRTQALTDDADALFAVRPTIVLEDEAATEGLVRDLSRLTGSLNLELFNTVDGTVMYGMAVPVSATVTGSKAEAFKKMATNIKSTDPVYVRFVKNARKKIVEYYDDNCATIVQRAQTLADTGKGPEAAALLESVPAETDCYETARQLLAELAGAPVVLPDTVVVENVVEVPVEVPVYVEVAPEPAPAPAPAPEPAPEPAGPTIKLSHPDRFSFKVLSCTGSRIGEQVTIVGEFVNKACRYDQMSFRLDKAFDDNGNEFPYDNMKVRDYSRASINVPRNLPVKIQMKVYGVNPAVKTLSYLYLDFDYMSAEIYNLPIDWQ
ncbi:MAG: hypothetical protein NC418_00880 [Muribaculaceae bacterium]|nr:hypothetical protein [Muribaculaceae bacterium]